MQRNRCGGCSAFLQHESQRAIGRTAFGCLLARTLPCDFQVLPSRTNIFQSSCVIEPSSVAPSVVSAVIACRSSFNRDPLPHEFSANKRIFFCGSRILRCQRSTVLEPVSSNEQQSSNGCRELASRTIAADGRRAISGHDMTAEGTQRDSQPSAVQNHAAEALRSVKKAMEVMTEEPEKDVPIYTEWLKEGAYVIHKRSGVCQFIRFETVYTDGMMLDCLAVKFRDKAVRFPMTQLRDFSPYEGREGKEVRLSKYVRKSPLSEANEAAARRTVRSLAKSLAKLYAQREQSKRKPCSPDGQLQKEFEKGFLYEATPDQQAAFEDVLRDMVERYRPMDRLVCGDVGFGKTEVAMRAMFRAAANGRQVAFMAPTSVLAIQHFKNISKRLKDFPNIKVALICRSQKAAAIKKTKLLLSEGHIQIVVGTHSLLSDTVQFENLGLLIVDEEQRFGVGQKEKIKGMRENRHIDCLTLSATPIPRTLYMSLSGVRDVSLIATPPPSRLAVKTICSPFASDFVYQYVSRELQRNGQVYYIVPRIKGIEERADMMRQMFPGKKVVVMHGLLDDLEEQMASFSEGGADILVSTTIIESGIDLPRVNTILIEDAQQFGLATLYQLRGRVGRGALQAYAVFFYPADVQISSSAEERLLALQEFSSLGSGFQIAARDMAIRGAGSLLGEEQSGVMDICGVENYLEMLQQALAEVQGFGDDGRIHPVLETDIDIRSVRGHISSEYVEDYNEQLSVYWEMARCENIRQLKKIVQKVEKKHGRIPKSMRMFVQLTALKQKTKALGIKRIWNDEGDIVMEVNMGQETFDRLLEVASAIEDDDEGFDGEEYLASKIAFSDEDGEIVVENLGLADGARLLAELNQIVAMLYKAARRLPPPDDTPTTGQTHSSPSPEASRPKPLSSPFPSTSAHQPSPSSGRSLDASPSSSDSEGHDVTNPRRREFDLGGSVWPTAHTTILPTVSGHVTGEWPDGPSGAGHVTGTNGTGLNGNGLNGNGFNRNGYRNGVNGNGAGTGQVPSASVGHVTLPDPGCDVAGHVTLPNGEEVDLVEVVRVGRHVTPARPHQSDSDSEAESDSRDDPGRSPGASASGDWSLDVARPSSGRGRGRPRKTTAINSVEEVDGTRTVTPKARGRPRKDRAPRSESEGDVDMTSPLTPRRRGRPRKEESESE